MGRTRHFENGLTPRQREVLRLIAKGHTNGEIADKLGVSLAGAKWHVSELLSRFGVNSREDLAELMERERRGPVERTRGWMAGLAGLVTLKVGAGTAVAAGVGVAAVVVGGVLLGPGWWNGESTPTAVEDTEPDSPIWTAEQAEAAAWLVAKSSGVESRTSVMRLNFDYDDLELGRVEWLPGITNLPLDERSEWRSSDGTAVDGWLVTWHADLIHDGGTLALPDGRVSIGVLVEDGGVGHLGYSAVAYDLYTGTRLGITDGLAPNFTGTLLQSNRIELQVISRMSEQLTTYVTPDIQGGTRLEVRAIPRTEPPPPPQPITIHAGARVAKLVVETADGSREELGVQPVTVRDGSTPLWNGIAVSLTGPATVIALDIHGNELGRKVFR